MPSRSLARISAVLLCLILATTAVRAWCDSSIESYALFQCADLAYFDVLPPPYTPDDLSAVFWQVGFGSNLTNSGAGTSGTGISGKSIFTGNDSGLFEVDIHDANMLDPRFPSGTLCLGSNNWANAGVDGCCDNPRTDQFSYAGYSYVGDDHILNPYFGTYLDSIGYPGYYSLASVIDYPTGVLLKTDDESWFAVAAVTSMSRGNDGTGTNGPCAAAPGSSPAPCDIRQGFFSLADVSDGLPNAIDPNRSNVIPWQATPAPIIDGSEPTDPNDPNSAVQIDVSWSAAIVHTDGRSRPSWNPTMGPADPNAAPGAGTADIAGRFGLVRYFLEAADEPDPNFISPTLAIICPGDAACTSDTSASVTLAPSSCLRLTSLFGPRPRETTPSTAACRVGRCGDLGYAVASTVICLGSQQTSSGGGGGSTSGGGDSSAENPDTAAQTDDWEPDLDKAVADGATTRAHIILSTSRPMEPNATDVQQQTFRDEVAIAQRDFATSLPEVGVNVVRTFDYIFAVSAEIDADGLDALRQNSLVRSISAIPPLYPALAQGIPQIGADALHDLGITGADLGISGTPAIAVIDDGIDWHNPALGGCLGSGCKVATGKDFTCDPNAPCDPPFCDPNNPPDPCDPNDPYPGVFNGRTSEHGTAVAGIAAAHDLWDGTDSERPLMQGVAPGARLVGLKVFQNTFSDPNTTDNALEALSWALGKHTFFNIRVVNISAGDRQAYDGTEDFCDPNRNPVAGAIRDLVNQGVAVTVASHNQGFTTGISWPACVSEATAVGAVYNDPNSADNPMLPSCEDPNSSVFQDEFTCFTNAGPAIGSPLDLLAPSWPTATTLALPDRTDPNDPDPPFSDPNGNLGYVPFEDFSGTSAATPYAAGAFALLMSTVGPGRPDVVNLIEQHLKDTGLLVPHPDPNLPSYPRIDLEAAYSALDSDGDSKANGDDNCDLILNTNQENADADSAGDACDCDPNDPTAIAAPVGVTGLAVIEIVGGYRFSWKDQVSASGTGTVYDVFSGRVSSLGPAGDFSEGSCVGEDVTVAQFDYTGPDPPGGDALYFICRSQNTCPANGTGTYGNGNRDTTASQSQNACQ